MINPTKIMYKLPRIDFHSSRAVHTADLSENRNGINLCICDDIACILDDPCIMLCLVPVAWANSCFTVGMHLNFFDLDII